MDCLELQIPPLPQLITAGHSILSPGMQHFQRCFPVYDMLIVKSGQFFITEDDCSYELDAGKLLILEPGRSHWGHRPLEKHTDIYWFHFTHPQQHRTISVNGIPWSSMLLSGRDDDLKPTKQYMVLPKFASVELETVVPLLEEIVSKHQALTYGHAIQLHVVFGQLLAYLQSVTQGVGASRSQVLCDQVIRYLQANIDRPFSASRMEQELHYHFDYLSRCLKQHVSMTPLQYLHYLQMEKAKWLLRQTDDRIQDVAEQVGQSNANYFSRLFRKSTGLSPGQYRKKYAKML